MNFKKAQVITEDTVKAAASNSARQDDSAREADVADCACELYQDCACAQVY